MSKLGTLVLDRVDTIVWLDLPLRTLLPRIWRRSRHRIRDHVVLWNGNVETWRGWWLLSTFTIRTHHMRRRSWPERFEGRKVVRLRSPEEISRWLAAQG